MTKTLPLFLLLFTSCGQDLASPQAHASNEPNAPQFSPSVTADHKTQWAPSGKASITPFEQGGNAFIGKLWLAAGAAVPEHQDETEEYLYILSGGGDLMINGKSYPLKAGSSVYMPAKATVSFKNGDEPLEAIQVFAGPKSAEKYGKWGQKTD